MIDATAGAISGAISRTVTSPLDVIKIRFQVRTSLHSEWGCKVQLEPTTSWALLRKDLFRPSKYTGMHQAAKRIFREEGLPVYMNMRSAFIDITRTGGFLGLYAGLQPTLAEIFLYAGLQFGTLDTCRRWARVDRLPSLFVIHLM